MRWDNFGTGARAVLDPTGKVFPARASNSDLEVRPFDEGVEALICALDKERESSPKLTKASRWRMPRLGAPVSLSRLRLVAVTASFLSAVLTSSLGLISLASGINWPVAVIFASSVVATAGIGAFFAALQRSLREKTRDLHHRDVELMRDAIKRMAENQVESLETRSLIRRSKEDPELANALLIEIVSEYNEAGGKNRLAFEAHSPKVSVEQVMKTASEDHPVVQMLRRLASDVQEAL